MTVKSHRTTYNAVTHKVNSLRDKLESIARVMGRTTEFVSVPQASLDMIENAAYRNLPCTAGIDMLVFDTTKVNRDLVVEHTPYEESVRRAIAYYDETTAWAAPSRSLSYEEEDRVLASLWYNGLNDARMANVWYSGFILPSFGMRSIIIIVLFVTACMNASRSDAQTRIEVRSGATYVGRIIADTADVLVLRTTDSTDVTIKKSNISRLEVGEFTKEGRRRSYASLGVTLGTPAGIHALGGYYFGDIGLRAHAGYWGGLYGGQISLVRNLSQGDRMTHSLSLGAGYSHITLQHSRFVAWGVEEYTTTDEWKYVSAAYSVNWHGFFLELGLSVGSGTFSNPQLMGQIGYVYDFRWALGYQVARRVW
jgi:hypothetical protein